MEAFVFQNNSETKQQSFYKSETKGEGQNKFGVGSVVELFSGENHETRINTIQRFSVFYRLCDDIWNWKRKLIRYK
jgi:UDP-N-acetyl-D-mannosaminuronic acid transferase (WecB/TagA/CpsF family)